MNKAEAFHDEMMEDARAEVNRDDMDRIAYLRQRENEETLFADPEYLKWLKEISRATKKARRAKSAYTFLKQRSQVI